MYTRYCNCRWHSSQHAVKPDIGSESRVLRTPPAFDAPVRGCVPVEIVPCRLVRKTGLATRWWKNFEDIFIRFDTIHECDGRTDGHTAGHRMTAKAARQIHHNTWKLVKTRKANVRCRQGRSYLHYFIVIDLHIPRNTDIAIKTVSIDIQQMLITDQTQWGRTR